MVKYYVSIKRIFFVLIFSLMLTNADAQVTVAAGATFGSFPTHIYCDATNMHQSVSNGSAVVVTCPATTKSLALYYQNNNQYYSCAAALSGGTLTGSVTPLGCGVVNASAATLGLSPQSTFGQSSGPAPTPSPSPSPTPSPTPTPKGNTLLITPSGASGQTFPIQIYCGTTNTNVTISSAEGAPTSVDCAQSSMLFYALGVGSCTVNLSGENTGKTNPTGCAVLVNSTTINLSPTSTFTGPAPSPTPTPSKKLFKGIGVNYAPGHYPNNDLRNDENQANVYAEMQQLKAAGFDTVRLYGDPGKTWIAVIHAANKLDMDVVYQIALCEDDDHGNCVNGSGTYSSVERTALQQLSDVIQTVSTTLFSKVVKLIIVGNEVLWQKNSKTNAADIVGSIHKVKHILHENSLTVPLTVSLQADVWIDSKGPGRQAIINSLATDAPLTMNVYPFQWMVPAKDAVQSDGNSKHSVDYYVKKISALYPGHPVMIAETGWATKGVYVNGENHVTGDLHDAIAYYPDLYRYVKNNSISLLAFMAFDTPTKDLDDKNMTSENHYGVFTDECDAKGTQLLPNTNYSGTPACNKNQSLFTFSGGSNTAQPPFSITISRNDQTDTINAPTQDRTKQSLTPWPTVILQKDDQVTLQGSTHTCTNMATSVNKNHSGGAWKYTNPSGCEETNWPSGQTIYLDAQF